MTDETSYERYDWQEDMPEGVYDYETDEWLTIPEICERLNEYDKVANFLNSIIDGIMKETNGE